MIFPCLARPNGWLGCEIQLCIYRFGGGRVLARNLLWCQHEAHFTLNELSVDSTYANL